jgi:hypothetical protein
MAIISLDGFRKFHVRIGTPAMDGSYRNTQQFGDGWLADPPFVVRRLVAIGSNWWRLRDLSTHIQYPTHTIRQVQPWPDAASEVSNES